MSGARKLKIFFLHIHDNAILKDMIHAFSDENLLQSSIAMERILMSRDIESGLDVGGVSCDILNIFWKEFYEECTEGYHHKIPILRHHYVVRNGRLLGVLFPLNTMCINIGL